MSAPGPLWRTRLAPAFLGLLALNLLVFAVWTGPRTYRVRRLAERGETARAEVDRQRKAAAHLRERGNAIRANHADIERFYRGVAGTEKTDLLPILRQVEDLARGPGLKPGTFGIRRDEVKDARVQRVAITLPLEGSYRQLLGFLRGAESSERFLTIDRVSMQAQGESGGAALQVELSSYVRAGAKREKGAGDGR